MFNKSHSYSNIDFEAIGVILSMELGQKKM